MEDPTLALLFLFGGLVVLVIVVVAFRQENAREQEPSGFLPGISPSQVVEESQPKIAELSTLLPREIIVLDLETTGLSPERDEIIEFGAIRATLDSDTHVTFQAFVKPTCKVPRKITEITGITQEMVDRDGLPIDDVLRQFVEFAGNLPIITFNADFDMGFLHSAARKHGFTIKNRYACALKRARRAWPGLPSYKLVDLARMGNLSNAGTHRALGDCERALIVFISATSVLGQRVRWTTPSTSSPTTVH